MFIKQVAAILLAASVTFANAQDTAAHHTPVTVSGNIQLTNNGTAPVPIFALDKPAIIATTTIRKGRFYANPEQYFSFSAKPWTLNNRIGVFIADNPKFTFTYSTNISLYFVNRNPAANHGEEFQTQRYWAHEFTGEYRFTPKRKLQFLYWHTNDMDTLGINREEFVNAAFLFDSIMLGPRNIVTFKPAVFYLYDEGALQGVFVAQTTTYQRTKWKFNLYIQTTFPLHVVPSNKFIWNGGVNIPF